jgi:SPX domain protein involved in polyphosphate accumulation
VMNKALDAQEVQLEVAHGATTIRDKWEGLVRQRTGVVIARLEVTESRVKGYSDTLKLSNVCSKIQAQLSGSECFSILDDRKVKKGQAAILVAARFGISYDELQEKILAVIGAAAEDFGPFSYSCNPLGSKKPRKY